CRSAQMARSGFTGRQPHALATLEISYGERVIVADGGLAGDGHGQLKQGMRQTAVDLLRSLRSRSAGGVEQQIPLHDALSSHGAEAQKIREDRDRPGLAVELIALTNLAMTVAVGRVRELDRDEHVTDRTEPARPLGHHFLHERLAHERRQELVEHDSLIVPAQLASRRLEHFAIFELALTRLVGEPVVRLEKGEMHLRDQTV